MLSQKVLFTEDECVSIINYKDLYDITPPPGYSNIVSKNRTENHEKKYNVYMIDKNDATDWIFVRLLNWLHETSGVLVDKNKIKAGLIHNYHVGDGFPKHIDRTKDFKNRTYNIGIQLTSNYLGGDYIVYGNPTEVIGKEIGNSYFYASDVLHEVTKINDGERWSFLFHINKDDIINNKNVKLL